MEKWRGGDWDETQNGAHVMRRKGCAMQNKGITLSHILHWDKTGHKGNVENMSNARVFSTFLECTQMSKVFYHIVIHYMAYASSFAL